MKRRTINRVIYDNDKEYDGHMEIVSKTVKDSLGSYTEYTLTVGDTSMALTTREFQELHVLMVEVMNGD